MIKHLGQVGCARVAVDDSDNTIKLCTGEDNEPVTLTRIECSFLSDLLRYAAKWVEKQPHKEPR